MIPELLYGPIPTTTPGEQEISLDPELLSLTTKFVEDLRSEGVNLLNRSFAEGLSRLRPLESEEDADVLGVCYDQFYGEFMRFIAASGGSVQYRTWEELLETRNLPQPMLDDADRMARLQTRGRCQRAVLAFQRFRTSVTNVVDR